MSAKKENAYRAAGILIPIVISFVALAVQWGVITTKLGMFEKRLEKHGEMLVKVKEDVSFIKGKME